MFDLVPLQAARHLEGGASTETIAAAPRVVKFGGSSLATPERIRGIVPIVSGTGGAVPIVVVVSAFQGVTDALLECADVAQHDDAAAAAAYEAIVRRHRDAARLLTAPADRATRSRIAALTRELREVLRGIRLLGYCPQAALDSVASFGERLSAVIVAGHLNRFRQARFVDAREFVATDDQYTQAAVNLSLTNRAVREYFAALWREAPSAIAVVTGFIGCSPAGRTTTIGRNGSDYTAAIVGAALGAGVIEIWTDVDGVLTGDPKAAPSPLAIREMTYDDALEMSHAGAKVLHPATIGPAIAKSIPILIKNTFRTSAPGTLICASTSAAAPTSGSVTSIGGLSLLTLRCTGRTSTRSHAARLSHALASRGVEVVFGCQACSELSISVAVRDAQAMAAIEAVQQEFCFELERGLAALTDSPHQAVVTVVGAGRSDGAVMAGGVFGALGRHAVALNAFTQGTTARSVSCVVDGAEQSRAVRIIHRELFEADRSCAVAVFGTGQVGGALLDALALRQPAWRSQGVDVKVIAVANSRRSLVIPDGVNLGDWRGALLAADRAAHPRSIAGEIRDIAAASAAVVDCTAGSDIVDEYETFAEADCHIITPNKRAGILPWDRYVRLLAILAARRCRLFDSTTVGAGLPVLAAIRDLTTGGDVIHRIEGILSGTLGYLFNSFDGSVPFSVLVEQARAAGLTEPDPRDDLSGQDVGRKLLILARAAGRSLELADVDVESLVLSDDEVLERLIHARARGGVLRYVATLDGARASAGLREVPRSHSLAAGDGCDNIVAITSDRYASAPLVIRGPGAGARLTARAIITDLGRLLPLNHVAV